MTLLEKLTIQSYMTTFDFYNANKNISWNIAPVPDNLSLEDKVKWIMSSGFGWIELDVSFDLATWKQEASKCTSQLVVHREYDDHDGWRSCCVHGLGVDKTGIWNKYAELEPEYSWTELAEKTPVIKQFWESLPFERFARVRFMEVASNGYVAPHSDMDMSKLPADSDVFNNIVPINIAVIHPTNCYMTLADTGTVPWQEGKVFLVNISKYHSVINFSNQPRLHMIGHGIPGNKKQEFCELVLRSYNKQYESLQTRSQQ
jgi:hypothetical protein